MEYNSTPVYRRTKTPSVALPIGARSVGHYVLPPSYIERPVQKYFVQLFWGVAGEGTLMHGRRRNVLEPEHVFIYFPRDAHHFCGQTDPWEFRWLTLDGPLNEETVRSFGLDRAPRRAGPCPEELFDQLEASIRDATPAAERRASAIAYSILAAACGVQRRTRRKDAVVDRCVSVIEEEYGDPTLTVQSISTRLGIHRSSLARIFKSRIGSSPQRYLISVKMRNALMLLTETGLRISEVAYRTGFRDPAYFGRVFRNTIGMSPRSFREAGDA